MKEVMRFFWVLVVVSGIVSCTYDKKEKAPETPPPATEAPAQAPAPAVTEEPAAGSEGAGNAEGAAEEAPAGEEAAGK